MDNDTNFRVPFTSIRSIKPHPRPEVHSLEIATVYDFDVVVSKSNNYKVGDKVFYVPIGAVLPQWLEDQLFPPDSKIKLDKHRIKAIKIQGEVSQGMLIPVSEIKNPIHSFMKDNNLYIETIDKLSQLSKLKIEDDAKLILDIVKYEPPELDSSNTVKANKNNPSKKNKGENPFLKKYGGLNNIKWYPDLFQVGEEVSVTEKIHGTNFRCGWVPRVDRTWFAKVKTKLCKWFGVKRNNVEFVFGSNNVQKNESERDPNGYYGKNYYWEAVVKYDLKNKLKPNEVVYGEIYGNPVQKAYDYECKPNERRLVLFDLKYETDDSSNWCSSEQLKEFCKERDLPLAPILYEGPWDPEKIRPLIYGNSALAPKQKVREGIVVKNTGLDYQKNRKAVKMISPDYLMKEAKGETSDSH